MRSPTLKNLEALGLERKQANLVKRLCKARDDRDKLAALIERECPQTDAYRRECYHDPILSNMWRTTLVLHAIDVLLGTCGVEVIGDQFALEHRFEFLNTGDTYASTLVYDNDTDRLFVASYGDIVERYFLDEESNAV